MTRVDIGFDCHRRTKHDPPVVKQRPREPWTKVWGSSASGLFSRPLVTTSISALSRSASMLAVGECRPVWPRPRRCFQAEAMPSINKADSRDGNLNLFRLRFRELIPRNNGDYDEK